MVVLLAAGACQTEPGASPPTPRPSPAASEATHASAPPAWIQDLRFSGAFQGTMAGIVTNQAGQRSECTGKNSRANGAWGSTIYGQIGADTFALVVKVAAYRGPGSYSETQGVSVQVRSLDDTKIYTSQPGDPMTFVVASDEESGTLRGSLSNVQSLKDTKLVVDGRWSCKT